VLLPQLLPPFFSLMPRYTSNTINGYFWAYGYQRLSCFGALAYFSSRTFTANCHSNAWMFSLVSTTTETSLSAGMARCFWPFGFSVLLSLPLWHRF
jgi:hypothetical protein